MVIIYGEYQRLASSFGIDVLRDLLQHRFIEGTRYDLLVEGVYFKTKIILNLTGVQQFPGHRINNGDLFAGMIVDALLS